MRKCAEEFLKSEKIEYCTVLPYSALREIRADIVARSGITPESAVVFLVPYYSCESVNISRYAVAGDYHMYLRELGARFVSHMKADYPEFSYKLYCDHSPIDERHAALIGGLGVLGENRLVINEKYGSYVFVAELISDAPPEKFGASVPLDIRLCEGCGACKNNCPTGRISNPLNPCLSDITQKKGELTADEIELMRRVNTVWGCDECQRVCPHNNPPTPTPIGFFSEMTVTELNEESLSQMDDKTFSSRAYSWRGRRVPERNIDYLKKSSVK